MAGYIEGDGCFSGFGIKPTLTLRISFNPNERVVLEDIAVGLNHGNTNQNQTAEYGIRFNDSRKFNQGELVIRKNALMDVLRLIHGHLIGSSKIQQIKDLGLDKLVYLNFEPLPEISYSSFWLNGFLYADGSIHYDSSKKSWVVTFSQNSMVNPLLINKIGFLVPSSGSKKRKQSPCFLW